MTLRPTILATLAILPLSALCQTAPATVPAGTPLAIAIDRHYPMRAGEVIHGHLLYPIYANNTLLVPSGAEVTGNVVDLVSDHSRRVRAMLGGDFTPFHKPEVRFTQIVLPDGTSIPLNSGAASTGTQIYRAVSPPPRPKGSFIHREVKSGVSAVRGDVAIFTAPAKGDRILQWIYGRLPYHPQRIEKGTSWTVETTASLEVPAQPAAPPVIPIATRQPHFWEEPTPKPQTSPTDNSAWIVQATLQDTLSSEASKDGQPIKAVVAEPIFNPDHTVAVPQGATLVGVVTRAKPARRFGRTGVLSFRFNQLILPNAEPQTVETRLTGADSAQNIALDSEGTVKSKPQDKIAIPLILALLAARPLDQDSGHGGPHHQAAKDGTSGAAGLGLVGTIVSIAGGSPYAAAGIGYWGAGRAFYDRWIARGQKIAFAKNTRIVVETTPRRAAPITSTPQR